MSKQTLRQWSNIDLPEPFTPTQSIIFQWKFDLRERAWIESLLEGWLVNSGYTGKELPQARRETEKRSLEDLLKDACRRTTLTNWKHFDVR